MGRMAGIFVKGATSATAGKAAITVKAVTSATIVITGAKGPPPIARTVTSPQVGASLTVRPVARTATVRNVMTALSVMTAMARAGGLSVRRAMTGRAAMTAMIVQTAKTVQIGPIGQTAKTVLTVRIGMAVRTGRTETAVVIRTVALVVGEMEARVVAPVVAPAVIRITAARARTDALALAAASPNGPEIPMTVPHLRQWCGF